MIDHFALAPQFDPDAPITIALPFPGDLLQLLDQLVVLGTELTLVAGAGPANADQGTCTALRNPARFEELDSSAALRSAQ